ncbi:MAG: hypothetical protein WCL71_11640 [Deltaproteobacteria bacterium]
MKPITLIAGISIIITALSVSAEDSAPSLPLSKAAQIAQTTLEELHLPSEFFIRSISLSPTMDPSGKPKYEARFEPPVRRLVLKQDDPAVAAPQPIKFRIIVVSMDGTAKVEEKEFTSTRSIVRKSTDEGSTTATNK